MPGCLLDIYVAHVLPARWRWGTRYRGHSLFYQSQPCD